MGADIQCYAEKRSLSVGGWELIKNFNSFPFGDNDAVYRSRDYDIFSVLANVRNQNNIIPISKPRGLPADISDEAMKKFCICIEEENLKDLGYEYSWVTSEKIDQWLETGYSRHVVIENRNYITDPDLHSYSWLTFKEIYDYPYWNELLERPWVDSPQYSKSEFAAINRDLLDLLDQICSLYPENDLEDFRLVFAFDS
jgi:hypothetical protein